METPRRFSGSQKAAIYLAGGGVCPGCREPLDPGWHADHVRARALGGETDVGNGQALCPACNLSKGTREMSLRNPVFDIFTREQSFVPPDDFEPRPWQAECLGQYMESVAARDPEAGQHRHLVCAGVGSGKTNAAALIGAFMLNSGHVGRIVYVAPNRGIMRSVRRAFGRFNVHLASWKNSNREGEPRTFQGIVLTYQSMAREPLIQRNLVGVPGCRTLVIFDELHHLGDEQSWGSAAVEAFGLAPFIVGLSGTPYRTDNREIPFVAYEPPEGGIRRYRADYNYSLGRAVGDLVCRKPYFQWLDGEVEITTPFGSRVSRTFRDEVSDETAGLRLSGAVRPGSAPRNNALRHVVERCRAEGRKLIIFVGGDSCSDKTAVEDANRLLPTELAEIGVDPAHIVSVTSNDPRALDKLQAFGGSPAWVLISVNMVSEGVDIPELSAAMFLTSVTAKQTTVQRIGRVLRKRSQEDPVSDALIFMFRDPRYVEFSLEILREIAWHELNVGRRREPPEGGGDEGDFQPRRRAEAIGIAGGNLDGMTINGRVFDRDQVESAVVDLASKGLPSTTGYLASALFYLFPHEDREVA